MEPMPPPRLLPRRPADALMRARVDYWFWRVLTGLVFGAALGLCIVNPGHAAPVPIAALPG
ncbi:hypothetical protein GGQ62_001705 [Polymorphobacter fuscus]|uniref:Uncharacterized protein n=2 Tax=Sandarakinorhabdus fusca TaxID=1439888 RepID=A0A7C9GP59_9SPHN|nr:hypothetical protein [Polymorphobacter fuscus]KAB7647965.1 hypothetical protein F9290_08460 [Polymorphobacter fuscus]MQT17295.1 hypothetical protein [Polymorphobacter fuscus]NJC08707.1 hypothetical protein [Polymorphobacter fuscus]